MARRLSHLIAETELLGRPLKVRAEEVLFLDGNPDNHDPRNIVVLPTARNGGLVGLGRCPKCDKLVTKLTKFGMCGPCYHRLLSQRPVKYECWNCGKITRGTVNLLGKPGPNYPMEWVDNHPICGLCVSAKRQAAAIEAQELKESLNDLASLPRRLFRVGQKTLACRLGLARSRYSLGLVARKTGIPVVRLWKLVGGYGRVLDNDAFKLAHFLGLDVP